MENYNLIKEFLEEEPILKDEFDNLRQSLEYFSDNFSKEEFDAKCEELIDFLELLSEIVALPKVNANPLRDNSSPYWA